MKAHVDEAEPDCLQYQVAQSDSDPSMLILLEQYADAAALAAHRKMPHFKSIIEAKIVPLLEKREHEFSKLVIS